MTSRLLGFVAGFAALLLVAGAGSARAEQALSGDQIKGVVAGATVEGTMNDGMAYSEYYDEDGTIKGKDYKGKWTIKADSMCFVYDSDPGKKMCYQVGQDADGIQWIMNGKVEGTGKVVKGNTNNY